MTINWLMDSVGGFGQMENQSIDLGIVTIQWMLPFDWKIVLLKKSIFD